MVGGGGGGEVFEIDEGEEEEEEEDGRGGAEEEELSARQLLTQPKLVGGSISSGAGEGVPCTVHQCARRGASEGIQPSAFRDQRSCSYTSTRTS